MFAGLISGLSRAAAGLPMMAYNKFLGFIGASSGVEQRLASSLKTASVGIYGAVLFWNRSAIVTVQSYSCNKKQMMLENK